MTFTKQHFQLLLLLLACLPIAASAQIEQQFVSAGNDVASITLTLMKKHQFSLLYTDVKTGDTEKWTGKWVETRNKRFLRFKGRKPNLAALTNPADQQPEVAAGRRHTIVFDSNQKTLWIWGTACDRVTVMGQR